ncbi:unnamed protein product [Leuciscus chuanchicus]
MMCVGHCLFEPEGEDVECVGELCLHTHKPVGFILLVPLQYTHTHTHTHVPRRIADVCLVMWRFLGSYFSRGGVLSDQTTSKTHTHTHARKRALTHTQPVQHHSFPHHLPQATLCDDQSQNTEKESQRPVSHTLVSLHIYLS